MLRRLGKDIAVYGAADFVFRFVGFAVFPIYAHVFTVEQFGIFTLVVATAGIVALFANLGLNNATQRYYWDPQTERAMQPALVSTGACVLVLWSSAVVVGIGAALYPVRDAIDSRYGIPWTIVVIVLVTIVPEQILGYCLNTLRLHFTPWKFVVVSFLKNLLGVLMSLLLVLHFELGLQGLFLGAMTASVVAAPVALLLIRRDLTTAVTAATARRLVDFGYPFVFVGLAYWLFGSVDRWMLAELSDATQLGLYAIGYKFGSAVLFLNGAFGQAWSPIAQRMRRDEANYRTAYARILTVWFFILVVAGSAVALFGPEVLRLLTPAEYWDAAPVLGILAMGIVLSGTTQITAVGISIARRTRLFAFAAWTTALVNAGLNLALIPLWGAAGAAFATFLSYALLTVLYLYWSQRLHPIPLQRRQLGYSTALVIGLVAASACLGSLGVSPAGVLAKAAILGLMIAGAVHLRIIDLMALRGVLGEGRKLKT